MTLVVQKVFRRVEDQVWQSSQWVLQWEYGKQIEGGDQRQEKNRNRTMEFAMPLAEMLVNKEKNQQEGRENTDTFDDSRWLLEEGMLGCLSSKREAVLYGIRILQT